MTEIKKRSQRRLDNSLHEAAGAGDIAKLERLLDAGAHVEYRNIRGDCAFHLVRSDRHPVRSLLLARGANIESRDANSRTALHNDAIGIFGHGLTGSRWLLDHGAQIEVLDKDGATPLALASMMGQIEICQLLLDRGARIDAKNKNGDTPLARSVMFGQYLVSQLLIDRGADMGCVNAQGDDLFSLSIKALNKKMCWRLIANGAEVQNEKPWREEYQQAMKSTPLEAAVLLGDERLLVKVLERDRDPCSLPERAKQALELANGAPGDEAANLLRSWLAKFAILDALAEINSHAKAIR